ncbi:hypothetical protein PHYSODRAFT_341104 [Phytophthora sojae]|uniref:Uncharacterized protein n=1 Tax=Phytophthora sojae (strain P6497) TaxID=1094619 RepID=G5AC62_PHYSP|nr:hypothetical protein PHYSODRAFT_341104 [Phytophthora sojae]EGZ06936.1 hypothetical protein PHYSODRAFT_341104 [Phytophthora sojae]|eukprot:XP_009537700.1 hypothetical protein PHYSODRAFT_341104 [Phytophthora sojae]
MRVTRPIIPLTSLAIPTRRIPSVSSVAIFPGTSRHPSSGATSRGVLFHIRPAATHAHSPGGCAVAELVSRPSRPVLLKPLLSPCITVAPLKSMVRREDVRAADIEVVDDELDTEDLEAAGCAVCASGAHRPRPPVRFTVTLPAPGTPVPSVAALVADAHALAQENQALRAQCELVSVNNAGLAAHASVLHDRNLALLHRAREGYQAGMANVDLEDRVRGLRDQAGRVDAAETQLGVFKASSVEDYHALQDQLAASQAQVADLSARLAAAPPSTSTVSMARLFAALGERDDARAERDDLRTRLAAAEAALVPVQAQLDAAVTQRDRARQSVARRERKRDGALAERDQARRDLVALEQERDAVVGERDQARQVSLTLEQGRDAAVRERDQARQAQAGVEQQRDALVEDLRVARNSLAQRRAETESAQRLNDPLQADVRRVNALLVAHAEELQRETARIRELEETVAAASTARVVAEAETARAQANELQAASRSGQYRTGWLAMRRRSLQRRDAAGAHIRRLSVRVADLADERDLAVRERDERAVAWRRMLRDARRSRELAQRVRDDLAGKLANSVSSVGCTIDTADLIRRLEATYAAEVNAAIPLPPADLARATPVAVSVASPPVVVAGSSGSAPSSGTVPSTSVSAQRPSSSWSQAFRLSAPFFELRRAPGDLHVEFFATASKSAGFYKG